MKHFLIIISLFLFSFSSQSEPLGFPVTFKAGSLEIATLEQYETRLREEFSDLEINFENVESVTYNEKDYKGLIVTAQGMMGGYKVEQKLTYILLHKDLWRMTFITGKTCVLGELLREGQWVRDWACDTLEFPLASEFADIFIIADKNTDLAQLSQSWGRQVEIISEQAPITEVEKTKSLGDIKKILLDNGSTWREENSTWSNANDPTMAPQPALKIFVSGQLNEIEHFEQTFLFHIDGDLLKLKEISGKLCRFVERMNKDICEDLYFPTKSTPFEMLLLNTLEVTENSNPAVLNQNQTLAKPKLSCVGISDNFLMALRYHFERGLFSQHDIAHYRRALSQLADVSDPMKIFLTHETLENYKKINESPYPMDDFLQTLQDEFNKGDDGSCDSLLPYVDELKSEFLNQNQKFVQLLSLIEEKEFNPVKVEQNLDQNDPVTLKFWQVIKASQDPSLINSPEKSIDVAAAHLKRYMGETLDRLNSPEELLTAAFVKQDAYSQLLDDSLVKQTQGTLLGFQKRKYFGLRVFSGLKNHYIGSLHPETEKKYDLKTGDKIIRLNQENAASMTALMIDQSLKNADQQIQMSVERNGQVHDVYLTAANIDPLKTTYSTEILNNGSNQLYLKIKITSFESGLGESLLSEVKELMALNEINGIIVDLQSNSGGYGQEAIHLLSFFMKDQTLAYYRRGSRSLVTAEPLLSIDSFYVSDTIPLIVQVNRYSQSASEIFASAVKDLNRGLIIGEKTFGKLVGQDFFPVELSQNRNLGMVITTTEYFSPLGLSLNGQGIEPDLVLFSGETLRHNDGLSLGSEYKISMTPQPYESFLTMDQIQMIQNTIEINNADIDQISLELLKAAENFIFARNQ